MGSSTETDGFCQSIPAQSDRAFHTLLTSGDYHILNWLSVLLENRRFRIDGAIAQQAKAYISENFSVDYKQYDIIRGYRADDSYFSFANAFLNNTISVTQLEKAMVLGKLGEQIVLISQKAFASIEFVNAIPARMKSIFPKSLPATQLPEKISSRKRQRGSILTEKYILDIMREGWKNDDERLQRIVLG